MKIISEGYVRPFWPYDEQWHCSRCGCRFTVDEDDPITVRDLTVSDRRPGDATYEASITCPMAGCAATVTVYDWRPNFK
jgi:hypothetical protein